MTPHRAGAIVATLIALVPAGGCALHGIPCDRWREQHEVTTIEGRLAPGETRTHLVPYDQRWSQNDIRISWTPARKDGGIPIALYATSAECANFDPAVKYPSPEGPYGRLNEPRVAPPPVIAPVHPCQQIGGRGGWLLPGGEWTQTSLIVAGGPKQRRSYLHEYRLHVMAGAGDAPASYSIRITWGPSHWHGCSQ